MRDTKILWFTGLSGSGKTTIANKLIDQLETADKKVMLIDGDNIRNTHHKNLKFTPDDIKENNRLIALRCKENIGKYDVIIVSIISPFRESRKYAREILSPHFLEVFIKADLQECIRRDVKGLYKRALAGEIENLIGVSPQTPYEEPASPEIAVDTEYEQIAESVDKIMNLFAQTKPDRSG